ncbi:MAG: DNA cytosine methyltransferase [Chroococcidiopsis sp.]
MLRHVDLFSGIGAWGLGARQLGGIEAVQHVEWDKFCAELLRKNFPGVPVHGDIATFDATKFRGIDLLTASPPCPAFSIAGRQQGSIDYRDRFPDTLRVVDECNPRWLIIENVPGLLRCPYQPGDKRGTYFNWLTKQLYKRGYRGEWCILSGNQFGLPHKRRRLFIVAYSNRIEFKQQPTPWADQIRSQSEAARAASPWAGSKSTILRSNDGDTPGIQFTLKSGESKFIPIGVASKDPIDRQRRKALGNSVAIPCAEAALKRVLYLNTLAGVNV